ncbi:hypothetical protein PGT21_017345 [Puccinia graminis f. sp. tritici]|uniref:Uncharacterized protein n=1 Tax=Puccinia graminis f. sp. tritici TaxID=56615 RepID=A0A5B0P860_PUCGR|nr:hypothetical protein PGT21_017345 [Puccinia graminis f. sp. tritici]KAA1131976.1 hypothetical protein PGTUg99_035116 [Puccinia graminis f. sp. tritici]
MENLKDPSDDLEEETERFTKIREHFINPSFLSDIKRIYTSLSISKGCELKKKIKNQEITLTVKFILEHFYKPQAKLSGKRQALEFLLDYYIVELLNTNYPKVINELKPKKIDHLVLQNQLTFMGLLLTLSKETVERSKEGMYKSIKNVLEFYDTQIGLQEWIDKFIEIISGHTIEGLWLTKESIICSFSSKAFKIWME